MDIETEIRALAFLKLEEILEKEYERMSLSSTDATNCMIEEIEHLVLFLKKCRQNPFQMTQKITTHNI